MLAGNNVLDMQRGKRRIVLVELAVLAAIAGAFSDETSRRGIHPLRWCLKQAARLPLQERDEFVRAHVTFVFAAFLRGEFTLRGLLDHAAVSVRRTRCGEGHALPFARCYLHATGTSAEAAATLLLSSTENWRGGLPCARKSRQQQWLMPQSLHAVRQIGECSMAAFRS